MKLIYSICRVFWSEHFQTVSIILFSCFITVDYFQLECYDVCMRRLEVLMDSNLDICAYNFTTFLIKRVFDPQNEFLEKEWLYGKRDNAYNILDLHLAILYKRKEDSSKLQYMVRKEKFDVIFKLNYLFREIFEIGTFKN